MACAAGAAGASFTSLWGSSPAKGVTAAWQYWVQDKGDSLFRFSSTYPSGRKVSDGSVDYWTFGPYGMPPDGVASFDDICGR